MAPASDGQVAFEEVRIGVVKSEVVEGGGIKGGDARH